MNLLHDVVESARKCRDFLILLPGNADFQQYREDRTARDRQKLDELMDLFKDESLWRMFDIIIAFTLAWIRQACYDKRHR